MIITVTLNPAIDKTVYVDKLQVGTLNRINKVQIDAGGKGINVSKTIKALKGETIAIGFVGGNNGNALQKYLEEDGIDTDFVEIHGETRVNTKLIDSSGVVTELNESGPVIEKEEIERLMQKIKGYAKPGVWFVLSGSIPRGVSERIYQDIILELHKKGAFVLLDTDGDAFCHGIEACPDVIKPNRNEMLRYLGKNEDVREMELVKCGQKLVQKGISHVIISLGEEGALFLTEGKNYKSSAIPIDVQSTVGAGDSMVAGFVYGMSECMSLEQCIAFAVATATASVSTKGTKAPRKEQVDTLLGEVSFNECFYCE